jgi:TolB-like protein
VVGFFAGVVTVIVVAGAMSRRDATETAQASSGPSIAVLLFQHYSATADDAIVAARLTDAVTTELARIGTVSVVSRASVSQYTGEMRPAREIAKALNVDFIMESTLTVESTNLHVAARLVDGTLDRKVWVGQYDAATDEMRELARRIAAESAAGALKYKATH